MDVRALMQQAVINHASRTCVVHRYQRLSFAEAWERGIRLANGLLSMGLQPGDRVGVIEDNSICVIVEGANISEEEIVQLCAGRLGSYKKPSGVTFQNEPLPKSPVGKIKRKDLREPFWEGHDRLISGS